MRLDAFHRRIKREGAENTILASGSFFSLSAFSAFRGLAFKNRRFL